MIKNLLLASAMLASCFSVANAQDDEPDFLGGDFSASVTFTTDYVFRGVSQTGGDATVQGSLDWASDLFYTGVWASGVDFNDAVVDPFTGDVVQDGTSSEFNFYAGYTPSLGPVSLDFNVLYFFYPDAPQGGDDVLVPTGDGPFLLDTDDLTPGAVFIDSLDQNYVELTAGASYTLGVLDLGISTSWSPDFYLETGNSLYTNLTAGFPLGSGLEFGGKEVSLAVSGNVGFQTFFEDELGGNDYTDFGVGITATYLGFDFDVRYVDTSGLAGNGSTGVFSVSRSF